MSRSRSVWDVASGGGTDEVTKCEQRLFRDSPMWAGAVPWLSGKEPSELRSWPRERLKIVQRRSDLGLACMEEHMIDHAADFAFSTVAFHLAKASPAALL